MVKYGSVSSASVQLTSAHCQAHHCQVRPVKMRSHSSSDLKGACQDSSTHVASRGSSQKESVSKGHAPQIEIIISSTLHHLQKLDFTHHLIWVSSFHSLSGISGSPLLSLSSSRAILIFDKKYVQGIKICNDHVMHIKFRVLWAQAFYAPPPLNCQKGQHLPALAVYTQSISQEYFRVSLKMMCSTVDTQTAVLVSTAKAWIPGPDTQTSLSLCFFFWVYTLAHRNRSDFTTARRNDREVTRTAEWLQNLHEILRRFMAVVVSSAFRKSLNNRVARCTATLRRQLYKKTGFYAS